jgi:hypothetical protein
VLYASSHAFLDQGFRFHPLLYYLGYSEGDPANPISQYQWVAVSSLAIIAVC